MPIEIRYKSTTASHHMHMHMRSTHTHTHTQLARMTRSERRRCSGGDHEACDTHTHKSKRKRETDMPTEGWEDVGIEFYLDKKRKPAAPPSNVLHSQLQLQLQ